MLHIAIFLQISELILSPLPTEPGKKLVVYVSDMVARYTEKKFPWLPNMTHPYYITYEWPSGHWNVALRSAQLSNASLVIASHNKAPKVSMKGVT